MLISKSIVNSVTYIERYAGTLYQKDYGETLKGTRK